MHDDWDNGDIQSSDIRYNGDIIFRQNHDNGLMTTGPSEFQIWLERKLADYGRGGRAALAKALNVGPDVITRILNYEPGKQTRRITVEEAIIISRFFGEVPPGFGHLSLDDGPTEFQIWLARKLDEHGHGSRTKLAEALGVRPDVITRILNHEPGKETRRVSLEEAAIMSRVFGEAPPGFAHLSQIGEHERVSLTDEQRAEGNGYHSEWKPELPGGLPQLDAQAGAGDGAVGAVVTIVNGGVTSGHLVTSEWVVPRAVLGAPPARVFALPVNGTSMEPGLKTDDIVFIETPAHSIKSGEIYVVDEGDGPMVKRIRLDRDQEPPKLWIISDNVAVPPYTRPAELVRVIGRVIGKYVKM